MAKKIDAEDLKKKADEAQKKIEKDKKKAEKEKAIKIEQKAQEDAQKWIERMPERLEEAAAEGKTKARVFWYGVTIGGGNYTQAAIDERACELVKEHCREQGLKTSMRDGQWNAPGVVHEYVLEVDFS